MKLVKDRHITLYGVTTPYSLDITANTTINVLNAKILQFYESGFSLYKIQLQNTGSTKRIYITLIRLAFRWVSLQQQRLL